MPSQSQRARWGVTQKAKMSDSPKASSALFCFVLLFLFPISLAFLVWGGAGAGGGEEIGCGVRTPGVEVELHRWEAGGP